MNDFDTLTKLTVKKLFFLLLSKRNNFNPQDNFVISAYTRGGSTWLAEVLHQIPHTAILFEPLHLKYVAPFRELGFCWRQYVPEDETWPEAEQLFEQLFRGKILNNHLCKHSKFAVWLKKPNRLVIKFCRANALLPWLTQRFNFTFAPIYLLRHPFAIVASQLKHPHWKNSNFRMFQLPNCRFNEIYLQHQNFLSTLETKVEALTAWWCLENFVPLRSPHNNVKWITVHYENLLIDPGTELKKIFDRWEIEIPANILEKVQKPSATTIESTYLLDKEKQLKKWKESFEAAQIAKMRRILDYFMIECYNEEFLPV